MYSDETVGETRIPVGVMTMALTTTLFHSPAPARIPASDGIRRRTLERLYERKAAIDELIESLERYQRFHKRKCLRSLELTAERTYS